MTLLFLPAGPLQVTLADAMVSECEVCSNLSKSTGALVTSRQNKVFRVVVTERVLALCEEHAREVQDCQASTFDELRSRFLEPFPGQRSLIPRRARLRAAQAPIDHRRSPGRRETDQRDPQLG
jgi:hypothetical protein